MQRACFGTKSLHSTRKVLALKSQLVTFAFGMALVRAEEAAPAALVTDLLDEGKDWKSVSHLPSIESEYVLVFGFGFWGCTFTHPSNIRIVSGQPF